MFRPGARRPSRSGRAALPRNVYRRGQAAAVPVCSIKAQCGACRYVNQDYREGLTAKSDAGLAVLRAAGVLDAARVLPPTPSPKELEYRSLFKLAVRASQGPSRFAIGLFAAGSHAVIDMDDCPLHTQPLKQLIKDLRGELEASTLAPYDEATHAGQLRYLAARSAHVTGELMLTFVLTETSGPLKTELRRIVQTLQRRGHKINSAHMNVNAAPGNAIFGPETVQLAGAARLRERLCDLDFEVGPTSFFQVNPWQAINLYRRVEQLAGGPGPATGGASPVAWDLYCGTGQISLLLARQGYRVLGVEENPQAVEDAGANARRNHLAEQAAFVAARVEHMAPVTPAWADRPALIVVNPSRRGLAESTREHLTELLRSQPQARFIYVSCEVETLARDLKELTTSGLSVRQIEPFDMFPQTADMEWLAVLSRG